MTDIQPKDKKNILIRCDEAFLTKVDELVEYYGQSSRAGLIRYAVIQLFLGDYRKNKYGYNSGLETSRARKREQGIPTNDAERIAELANMDAYTLNKEMVKRGYFTDKKYPNGDIEIMKVIPNEGSMAFETWVLRYHPGDKEPYYKFILHSNFDELMTGLKKEKKLKI